MVDFTLSTESCQKTAFIFGFTSWKTFFTAWLPDHTAHWGPSRLRYVHLIGRWLWRIIRQKPEIYVWSYNSPRVLEMICKAANVPLIRVEDGFLRSVDLGARHTTPLSLCFDRSGYLYFDSTGPSDLEQLIQTYDFSSDRHLMERAKSGIQALISSRLSKYNVSKNGDVEELYGVKTRKRILVLGQVDGDQSILKGCDEAIDNNTFVRRVAAQNPDAQVIYKPHPEVLSGIRKRPRQSNPREVDDVALILDGDIALADSFKTIDEVHTITSLSGFEALLRGIPVHCYGMPFYAGWGLTTDRMTCERRTKTRTIEEVFAAAYILYPTYRDPESNRELEFEEAMHTLEILKAEFDSKMAGRAEQSR